MVITELQYVQTNLIVREHYITVTCIGQLFKSKSFGQ